MTVGTIPHDFPVMDASLMVNLPEDDATALGGTQTITAGGVHHLLEGEKARSHQSITELAIDGQAVLPHIR